MGGQGVARQSGSPVDLLGHQDLAVERPGQVLQPRGDVDGVADHGELGMPLIADVAGDHDAGVDPDAEPDRRDGPQRQCVIEHVDLF